MTSTRGRTNGGEHGENPAVAAPLAPGDVLTPTEVGEILRVPAKTIVQLCREGRIPRATKVGRQWRILRVALSEIFVPTTPPQLAPTELRPRRRRLRVEAPATMSRQELLKRLRGT